jgi:integrase
LSHNGKTLPTKFNTHTDDEKEAEQYVNKNKEKLIEGYLSRKNGKMFKLLENFYKEGNEDLSDKTKHEYDLEVNNRFIPFLKTEKIFDFGQINRKLLIKYQEYLLAGGMRKNEKRNSVYKPIKPQSVNNIIMLIRKMFDYFLRTEIIQENPCEYLKALPVNRKNRIPRGCYNLDRMNGIFNRKWKDERSYLLCSLIYSTGMRNCEIKRLKLEDIQEINNCRFININQSKTINGIRLIPLKKELHIKLKEWAKKNKIEPSHALFNYNDTNVFRKANRELAKKVKASEEELLREHITFYSGRHWWKTLMSAEGLGEDIEEVWMGHKVSSNVAKNYNHKDKMGRERIVKKAKTALKIVERYLFCPK